MPGVMQPLAGTIAVCEPQPYWTPLLQRDFASSSYVVRSCRAPRELPGLIGSSPGVVICDVSAQPADFLNWFATPVSRRWPIIVCGSPRVAELEPVYRELGVRSFLPDLIPIEELAQLCRRWLKRNCLSPVM